MQAEQVVGVDDEEEDEEPQVVVPRVEQYEELPAMHELACTEEEQEERDETQVWSCPPHHHVDPEEHVTQSPTTSFTR